MLQPHKDSSILMIVTVETWRLRTGDGGHSGQPGLAPPTELGKQQQQEGVVSGELTTSGQQW